MKLCFKRFECIGKLIVASVWWQKGSVCMTLMPLRGVSRYPWRSTYILFYPNYHTLYMLYCLEIMLLKVFGYHTSMEKLIFGIHLMIQGFCMTLMLQNRVYLDPWKLPNSIFWPKYNTLYPIYCLDTVFKWVLWYRKTYCCIHLMIQRGMNDPIARERGQLETPMGRPIASFDHCSITPYILYIVVKPCLLAFWGMGK